MLYPEYSYYGYKRDLRSQTAIVSKEMMDADLAKGGTQEAYASILRFGESTKLTHAHLADLTSDTKFYSDYLVFDFDSHEAIEHAYQDANELVLAITKMGGKCEVYFSGNKGFHVLVPACQFAFMPTSDEGILRRMAESLANRFKTFDTSIYNKTRVFRLPNSLNQKGSLYKIAVPNITETDVDTVLAMAKEPSDFKYPEPDQYPKVPLLCRLFEQCKNKVNRSIQVVDPKESFHDFGLIKEAILPGKRNETLYKMSRDLARHGIYERDALIILKWWNNSLPHPMGGDEVERTVHSAYTKGVNQLVVSDNIFNFAYNSKKALNQVRLAYQNWAENVVKTGYGFLDDFTLGFFKGEVVFIISRPGNFKTCVLSNILHGISRSTGRPCLFFSMEMSVEALTCRHIQKAESLTQKEVLEGIKNGLAFEKYEREFANVHVIDLSALNTEKVLQIIDQYLEEHGSLGAIGFDYLSLFEGCANDTARTARMATELKTRIAKAAKCPTFCLVQAKREYGEGDLELDMTAGKDSSSIEDSGDYVIGMWAGDGKFLKHRKYDSIKYQPNPYFRLNIDKAKMDLKSVVHLPHPPTYKQKVVFQ